jgi:enediyne biosynthesis protein E4
VYRNDGNRRFRDISDSAGPAVLALKSSRGLATGDVDGDGSLEVLVNNMEDRPQLLKNSAPRANWLIVKTVGTKSNRDGIGARVTVVTGTRRQLQDVRSGGSYASQSDFRLHFGLANAEKADRVEVRWPSGMVQKFEPVPANRVVTITEGIGMQ